MPIIELPKKPIPEIKENEEVEECEFWECGCGSTMFYLWSDGSAECAGCRDILDDVRVMEINKRPDEES